MKLIINIPEWKYKSICEGVEASKKCGVVGIDPGIHEAIYNGTPLDDDLESLQAEVRAYFNGQAYGWEEGRKALIEDVRAEIETDLSGEMFDCWGNETRLHRDLMDILNNINKESED